MSERINRRDAILREQGNCLSSVSSSPSYTLAELTQLSRQFVKEHPVNGDSEWLISIFLAWLERREREAGNGS